MIDPGIATIGASLLGGLFGGGGGGSTQPPYQYSYGGGSSFGEQNQQQQSISTSSTDPARVWGGQSSYLTDLYAKAQANLGQVGPATQATTALMGQGYDALGQLMNPQVNPILQMYQEQLQRGMEQNILPAIRREAIGFGQYGGSRQGVAEGLAAQEAGRMSRDFAAQVYGQDRDRMLGAAQALPAMAQAGLGVPWYGLQQYANILGSPTVLAGGSRSATISSGTAVGLQGSEDFQESFSSPDRSDVPFPPRGGGGGESFAPSGDDNRWGSQNWRTGFLR